MRVTNVEELESDEKVSVKIGKTGKRFFFFLPGISRYCFHQGICCFRNRKYLFFSRLELPLSFCHLNRLSIELSRATVAVFATMALAADFPALDTICCVYNVYFP